MRVYHFLNRKYGLQNIRRRRLKIATLNELNDPFELLGLSLSDARFRKAVRSVKNELGQQRGILCFSRQWRNPVQWSHYADRHRGLCLGFDIPDEFLSPIKYVRRRLEVPDELIDNPSEIDESFMEQLLLTKFSHWRYEDEVRCFVSLDEGDAEKKLYFCPFSDQIKLAEVIIGATSDISRLVLKRALGKLAPEVEVFKARLAYRTFRVVRQKREDLWT